MIKKNYKLIILIFFYLLVFYFLIFNNILNLMELKENFYQLENKIEKLSYEKKINSEALEIKRKDLDEYQKKIDELTQKNEKEKFSNISSLLSYLKEKIYRNNILFESFARSQRNDENLKITINFYGSEDNIKSFFDDVENDIYDINFSSSSFIMTTDKNTIKVTVSLNTKLEENSPSESITLNNKNIFNSTNIENGKLSMMKIGKKNFYRRKKER